LPLALNQRAQQVTNQMTGVSRVTVFAKIERDKLTAEQHCHRAVASVETNFTHLRPLQQH